IGETDVDPARDQGPHQTFRTVHPKTPFAALIAVRKHRRCSRSITPVAVRQRGVPCMVAIAAAAGSNFNRVMQIPSPLLAKIPPIWPVCASGLNSEEPDDT